MQFWNQRLPRVALILGFCLAVVAGVAMARLVPLEDARLFLALLPLCLLSVRRHAWLTLLLLVLLGFGAGWWRGTTQIQQLADQQDLHYQKVVLVGRATDDAVYGERYQLEFVMDHARVVSPQQHSVVSSVTVRGFGEPMVYRGDIVRVEGKLYPSRGNSLTRISFAQLDVLARGTSPIDELRRRFAAGMQSALPEPAASFGLGLLIGQRTTLPEETADQLRMVGLTHIIAVSGYNLTVIVLAVRRLLAKRSKFQATAACVFLILLFLLITGSSPPIVRASIISMLSIAAWHYGRTVQPLALLLVAIAITLLANPLFLWGNISWYLSFLAFFGVLVLAPLISKRIFGAKDPPLLIGIAIETLCASLLTAPFILFIFGELSAVALLANLLVVPFIPIAMVLGLVAGLAGMLLPALAGWFAWPAMLLLTYMLDVAHLLSRIPHAFLEHIAFPLPLLLVGYGIIGLVCLTLWHKTRQKYGIITDKKQVT